jgi:glycosyl hydrolase family 127 (putative beta-L-arabinofuranosidase)/beta-L-arabinofuranosidase (glycosyl hydrolase family 127)
VSSGPSPAPADLASNVTARPALQPLPLGSVKPAGWLAKQLRLQADGLTGSLEDLWPDVGPDSAWLGGGGEDWERGPYYLDGLVPLAHVLGDERLLAKASRWVESILTSQRPDGSFGPTTNDDWWPRMVALKALTQHADATSDARVPAFLEAYFRFQLRALNERPLRDWGRVRGADNVLSVEWLWRQNGDPSLVELPGLLLAQTADWGAYLRAFPCTGITRQWDHMTHVVNVAMGLKTPAVRSLFDGDPDHHVTTATAIDNLDRYHGQVHGMFSGDEWLAGPEATRGVELCAVVELMFSFEQMIRIWGDGDHVDRLERLAYNLLPATLTADMTAHQYHQQANQVLVTIDQRDWTQAGDDCLVFGLEPNFGCCTANLHQGWPKFVASMWMATSGGGLAAIVHGPSTVQWQHGGATVTLEARTDYPFGETIEYVLHTGEPLAFALRIRVPGWCDRPQLALNGAPLGADTVGGHLVIDRTWSDGDRVSATFPMETRAIPRARGATGLALGPLVLAYSPGEVWRRVPDSPGFGDWEVSPRRSWNLALAIDETTIGQTARVERSGPASPPFGLRTGAPPFGVEGVPLKVWVPGRRVPDWLLDRNSAASPPDSPVEGIDLDRPIPLVPYGSARVRIVEFPTALPSGGVTGTPGPTEPVP